MEFQSPFEFDTINDRVNEAIYEEMLSNFTFLEESVITEGFKDSKFYKDIQASIKKVEKIFKDELRKFGSQNKSVKSGVSTKGQIKPKEVNSKTVEQDKIEGHGVTIATYKNVDNEMVTELKGRVNARIKDFGKITSHKTNNRANSSAPDGFIMFVYKRKPLTEEEFDLDINKEVFNEAVAFNYINEANIKRSSVKEEDFGVPSQKKFPMIDAKHVKSAIKFFNYVDKEHEAELAKNIRKKMQQFGINMNDINVSDKNRFKQYLSKQKLKESTEEFLNNIKGEANSHVVFESSLFENEDNESVEENNIDYMSCVNNFKPNFM